MRGAFRTGLVGVAACALVLSACTGGSPSGPRQEKTRGGLVTPSITREADGQATAVGTLAYRRDMGGVFVLVNLTPGEPPTTSARVIAVLTQSKGQTSGEDLAPLVGAYCAFSGKLVEATSTAAAPELTVESFRILKMPESAP